MPAMSMSRRALLRAGAGLALAAPLGIWAPRRACAAAEYRLTAAPARWPLVAPPYPATEIWGYNGQVPGPELRVRQGEPIRIVVENRLAQETTVHCHGIRLPNAMDGVPYMTQPPIKPGESFVYEFTPPDAGTFWYHPHIFSSEQLGRGLYGALIVEERQPIAVDRDLVWVLDDWRLTKDAGIDGNFGNWHDASHNGRIGNTVTINGRVPADFAVRAGERIRLRLINVANARIFGLRFKEHAPAIIAIDGQPIEPHAPDGGQLVLAPGMRCDVILDCTGRPGESFTVIDDFYARFAYKLVDLRYGPEPVRSAPPAAVPRLPPNPLPEPDLARAERHAIVLGGGMMGGMASAVLEGRVTPMPEMLRQGVAWAINGVAERAHAHAAKPLFELRRNASHVLAIQNESPWHHPMHLHGHSFRVVARDGTPTRRREWCDMVLLAPRERADIAFVADNPGDWMFHCHILEHQEAGLMNTLRVA
jgi:FtsP/CotA-like multicopper oxidase with cupredoxin domain